MRPSIKKKLKILFPLIGFNIVWIAITEILIPQFEYKLIAYVILAITNSYIAMIKTLKTENIEDYIRYLGEKVAKHNREIIELKYRVKKRRK